MAISYVGAATDLASAINGGTATITYSNGNAGDCVIVAVTLGTTKAQTLSVTSSSGAAYSQIVATTTSSNARFGAFRRIIPARETQAVVAGTGGSTDSTAAVAMVFRNVDRTTPEDVTPTSTTGASVTPDSPSITPTSTRCGIITTFGAQINDALVTAPASFANQLNTTVADTYSVTIGAAWLNGSSSPFDPASWTGLTLASWVSATIALRPLDAWNFQEPLSLPDHKTYDLAEY